MSANRKSIEYECVRCGQQFPMHWVIDSTGCQTCRAAAPANFRIKYAANDLAGRVLPDSRRSDLWRYESFLPVAANDAVSLGEGGTPLTRAESLENSLGLQRLYIKDESCNPTWSHKDRLSTVAISHARRIGAKVMATSSSGNAGASLAAYAAKARIPCVVLTFAGASGALIEQIRRYGALVAPLAHKDMRWPILRQAQRDYGWYVTSPFSAPVVGSHPVGIEGYKTIAYEIFEQLGGAVPDWISVPVAYGDAAAGIWQGFLDLREIGAAANLPRLLAGEIYGSLKNTLPSGADNLENISSDRTTRCVSIGSTQSSFQALNAIRASDGIAETVEEDEIAAAQRLLATSEGIFGELSSVVSLAAARKAAARKAIPPNSTVVCLNSAAGLKDLEISGFKNEVVGTDMGPAAVDGDSLDAVMRFLQSNYGLEATTTTTKT